MHLQLLYVINIYAVLQYGDYRYHDHHSYHQRMLIEGTGCRRHETSLLLAGSLGRPAHEGRSTHLHLSPAAAQGPARHITRHVSWLLYS